MIFPIVAYGAAILRKKAQDIESSYPDLTNLIDSMWETMYASNGVGLAAPQVGISRRLFVMEVGRITYFIFNPVITRYGTDMIAGQEGCLSFPDEFITVPRSRDIYGTYQNFRGETIEFAFHGGLLSVCFQHEYDHLNGIVMHERAGVDRSTT